MPDQDEDLCPSTFFDGGVTHECYLELNHKLPHKCGPCGEEWQ